MSIERTYSIIIPHYAEKYRVGKCGKLADVKHPTESHSLSYSKMIPDKEQESIENISITDVHDNLPRVGTCILQAYLNKSPSLVSVWRWVKCCGFSYDIETKFFTWKIMRRQEKNTGMNSTRLT